MQTQQQGASSATTFFDSAVENFEVVSHHKTYGNEKKWILPILSQHKPNENMKNALKSRFFVLMTCQMKTKVIFVFIPDSFDKSERWMY